MQRKLQKRLIYLWPMPGAIIIPARYASTRFPGKALAMLGGQTVIERVYRQAAQVQGWRVLVATDDDRIAQHVGSFGGAVVMTGTHHPSGTDRVYEAVTQLSPQPEFVINVQGDEPFVQPEQIIAVAELLSRPEVQIATLVRSMDDTAHLHNPSKVKVVIALDGRALYFSRSGIPYLRETGHAHQHLLHVGLYGYKTETLAAITALPPSPLEQAEALEQLRWLENGFTIHTALTNHASPGIDTPNDLQEAINRLAD